MLFLLYNERMQTWREDKTTWVDLAGDGWGWLSDGPRVVVEPMTPARENDMQALDEVLRMIEAKLAEAESKMAALALQIETLNTVRTVLTSGEIDDAFDNE